MKKVFGYSLLATLPLLLSGCAVGDKNTSMAYIYGFLCILALLLLVGCCAIVKTKNLWLTLLFSSVLVVNCGYFCLSVSTELHEALLANRLAYLGSVFLPFSMLMIVLDVTKQRYKKWLLWVLTGLCLCVFIIAASPGYSTVYYKEVTLEFVDGVAVLNKVYGPLHGIYLYFLIFFFGAMIAALVRGIVTKRIFSVGHAVILIFAVFANIAVWLMEQMVKTDFEILSVSYIISELFLLGLHLLLQEQEKLMASGNVAESPETGTPLLDDKKAALLLANLPALTQTERIIFDHYIAGKISKEVCQIMHITENTLKYHNRNIYSKLGVSSRKELVLLAKSANIQKSV